jgi:hypothetical protein
MIFRILVGLESDTKINKIGLSDQWDSYRRMSARIAMSVVPGRGPVDSSLCKSNRNRAMWTSRLAQVWYRVPSWNPFQRQLSTTMGAVGQHKVHTSEQLARLRDLMKKEDVNVQAYVVPSQDQRMWFSPFQEVSLKDIETFFFCLDSSEYIASCDKRRAFISGFNGSAGVCGLFDSG